VRAELSPNSRDWLQHVQLCVLGFPPHTLESVFLVLFLFYSHSKIVLDATRLRVLLLCRNVQVQSNALAALEAIDTDLANAILEEGCVTGDRINGLCDGITGDWWVLATPDVA
jgi:hypothetical protein